MDQKDSEITFDKETLRKTSEKIVSGEAKSRSDALIALSQLALRASKSEVDGEMFVGELFTRAVDDVEQDHTPIQSESDRLVYLQEITKSGTWAWDSKTSFRTYDVHYALLAGYTTEDIEKFSSNTWEYLTNPDDEVKSKKLFSRCVDGGIDEYSNEKRIHCKDGSWIWVREQAIVIDRDEAGKALSIHGAIVDITEIKNLELKVEALIDVDELTGLNNYYFYKNQFDRLNTDRRKTPVSFIDIELDNSIMVNNTYGKQAVDELLIRVAEILNKVFRPYDCVARIGESEFMILLPDVDENVANSSISRIKNFVEEYNNEFSDMPISLSIGVATAGIDESLADAVTLADDKVYEEKSAKKKKAI